MKKFNLEACFMLSICFLISGLMFAQTPEQRTKIANSYDQHLLSELSLEFSKTFEEDFAYAKAYAEANNIPLVIEKENGGIAVLHKVLEDGTLLYTTTTNLGAGITVRANRLHAGPTGTLDLEVEGEGIVIGIWDGGIVLPSHELLENRVQQIDDAPGLSSHATHVAGTMIGSGTPQGGNAKGMAPKATLLANDFNNDLSEMTVQAAAGLIISNHSYGFPAGDVPISFLGNYASGAAALDNLLYNTPYYLSVHSAGNDRNTGVNPDDNGYDLLTGDKVAKNNMVVAAVNNVANYTGPNSVVMSGFSSWGPSDDGRIKPDISAKGVNTFSSVATNNSAYANFNGTSMASPSVTGALALLQELHSDLHGDFMKSATLKALAIHTALEAGTSPGPDYSFGWGLLNTEAAAKALLNEGFQSLVDENTLANGATFTRTVTSNGIDPLIVSIVWTDPAGNVQSNIEDDLTPRLVNDLDIVLEDEGGNFFYPWKFIPGITSIPASKGVNNIDNVEKVEIDAPAGNYIVRVTHKGTLQGGAQDYSLVATGISEALFTYTPDNITKSFCANEVGEFQFNYESDSSFNGPTTLSVSGLPTGAVATFIPAVITADQDFVLEISGLGTVNPGVYPIVVTGTSASYTKTLNMEFEVESADPINNLVVASPSNGATNVFIYPTLAWNDEPNATEYIVEVSIFANFAINLFETTTTENSINIPGLESNTQYYWRVKPISNCVEGNFTNANFTTETTACSSIATALDTPINIITTPTQIESVITIPLSEGVLIGDINVTMDLTHSWLADLTISLISPAGTEVILMSGACDGSNDADVIFDDSGFEFTCSAFDPAVAGVLRPQNPLTPFITEDSAGDWTLRIIDGFNEDGGSLNNFALEFCATAGPLSIADNEIEGFELFPNPANDYFEFSLKGQNSKINLNVYDINGRSLITKRFDGNVRKMVNIESLSSGIYLVEITSGNQKSVKKLIVN